MERRVRAITCETRKGMQTSMSAEGELISCLVCPWIVH
jgi:hypothetical protein